MSDLEIINMLKNLSDNEIEKTILDLMNNADNEIILKKLLGIEDDRV